MKSFLAALDARLVDDWRRLFFRFWTVRLGLFWGAVSALYLMWPAFGGVMPLWLYATLGVAIGAAIAVARITKQAGVDV